ncbi:MAG: cell division protein ZapA [Elusimicrobia bacterium]|nr:cell division protein ZapA [Elusimicrobiota bacterium]
MNEKVDIEIFRRKLTVEMEGLTPIEINALAQKVHEKMAEISESNPKIADSSKLAIITALDFAAELEKIREARQTELRVAERKMDEMALALQNALGSAASRE